jgi:hypothetical protein
MKCVLHSSIAPAIQLHALDNTSPGNKGMFSNNDEMDRKAISYT